MTDADIVTGEKYGTKIDRLMPAVPVRVESHTPWPSGIRYNCSRVGPRGKGERRVISRTAADLLPWP